MKTTSVVALLAALSSANAFAPATSGVQKTAMKMSSEASELEGMIGADIETGGRIVSFERAIFVDCYRGILQMMLGIMQCICSYRK